MKATDLMIGDWVLCNRNAQSDYEFDNVDYKPYQITNGEDIDYAFEQNMIGDADVYQPIPLTAEILKRNCKNILSWKGKGYEWTWYNEDDGYIELSSRAEGETCKDGFFVSANGGEYRLFTIHYVHELQHALKLCGIEKEIKL